MLRCRNAHLDWNIAGGLWACIFLLAVFLEKGPMPTWLLAVLLAVTVVATILPALRRRQPRRVYDAAGKPLHRVMDPLPGCMYYFGRPAEIPSPMRGAEPIRDRVVVRRDRPPLHNVVEILSLLTAVAGYAVFTQAPLTWPFSLLVIMRAGVMWRWTIRAVYRFRPKLLYLISTGGIECVRDGGESHMVTVIPEILFKDVAVVVRFDHRAVYFLDPASNSVAAEMFFDGIADVDAFLKALGQAVLT